MAVTTSFFVPVLMPGATADSYTVGRAVLFTDPSVGIGGGGPAAPTTGQIWPRGRGV